jgi:hypothetical protein
MKKILKKIDNFFKKVEKKNLATGLLTFLKVLLTLISENFTLKFYLDSKYFSWNYSCLVYRENDQVFLAENVTSRSKIRRFSYLMCLRVRKN